MASCTTEDSATKDSASEENSNPDVMVSENLTGTWVSTSIEDIENTFTMQHSTSTVYSTLYITESGADITIVNCEKYSVPIYAPIPLVKEGDLLKFVGNIDTPFTIISPNELNRTYVISDSYGITNYNQTLTKTSSSIDLSRGSLQFDGPISANNKDHVCLIQRFGTDPSQGSRQKVIIPFDNDFLEFGIGVTEPLVAGDYQYDSGISGSSNVLYSFNIYSNADTFWNQLGTNGLFPNLADLTITTSQPELIEGNFSFIGLDGGSYTGNFSAVPY